jgi:hypothetical protein
MVEGLMYTSAVTPGVFNNLAVSYILMSVSPK